MAVETFAQSGCRGLPAGDEREMRSNRRKVSFMNDHNGLHDTIYENRTLARDGLVHG